MTHKYKTTLPIDDSLSLHELIDAWKEQNRVKRNLRTMCLEWQGATNNFGFGVATTGGKSVAVHRVVLSRKLGRAIIPDAIAYQTCKNPLCVEPGHLQEVSKPPKKTERYRTRIGENTIQRMLPLKDKLEVPRYNREPGWIPDALRYLISTALDALETNLTLAEGISPEPKGEQIDLRVDANLHDRIESQRQPNESKYAVIKRLVEVGLKVLKL